MRNKLVSILLFCTILFCVTACNNKQSNANNKSIDKKTEESVNKKHNGHEYVDLGLPSGTLWATCNVGATTPEEYGDHFAWGEIKPKTYYNWENEGEYKWGVYNPEDKIIKNEYEPIYVDDGGTIIELAVELAEDDYIANYGMIKYNATDGKTVLDLADDAAHANWGGAWRMPTKEEIDELREHCCWIWSEKGYKVVGEGGKYIFLPAAGYRTGDSWHNNAGSCGNYWSSSLDTSDSAYELSFESDRHSWIYLYRCIGSSVRPVFSKE